jgi:hypothetical protein
MKVVLWAMNILVVVKLLNYAIEDFSALIFVTHSFAHES